ncbi:Deoxyhypusine synthase [Entamoeba marina]
MQSVKGYDFNNGINHEELLKSYFTTGIQSTHVSEAVEIINKMLTWKPEDMSEFVEEDDRLKRTTIYLGFTSNMMTSGLRETIRYLVENKKVDYLVTTAGAVEVDIMKCLGDVKIGDFYMKKHEVDGERHGNFIFPTNLINKTKDWLKEALTEAESIQNLEEPFTPSEFIAFLGKKINDESSVLTWCYRNGIKVFCPAITDGMIGTCLVEMNVQKKTTLKLDIVRDLRILNSSTIHSVRTGAIILGGGVMKHHILNANLMRNGCDYAVYINTAGDFDGCDAGARPDEAVSWGKIKMEAEHVKIVSDVTLVFPLIVSQTFAVTERFDGIMKN